MTQQNLDGLQSHIKWLEYVAHHIEPARKYLQEPCGYDYLDIFDQTNADIVMKLFDQMRYCKKYISEQKVEGENND